MIKEGVLGLFGDNIGIVIRWEENYVKATNKDDFDNFI